MSVLAITKIFLFSFAALWHEIFPLPLLNSITKPDQLAHFLGRSDPKTKADAPAASKSLTVL